MTLGDAVWAAIACALGAGLLDRALRALEVNRLVALGAVLAIAALRTATWTVGTVPTSIGDVVVPAMAGALLLARRGPGRRRTLALAGTATCFVAAIAGAWPPLAITTLLVVGAAWLGARTLRQAVGGAVLVLSVAPLLPLWAHGLAPAVWPLGAGPGDDALAVGAAATFAFAELTAGFYHWGVPGREQTMGEEVG